MSEVTGNNTPVTCQFKTITLPGFIQNIMISIPSVLKVTTWGRFREEIVGRKLKWDDSCERKIDEAILVRKLSKCDYFEESFIWRGNVHKANIVRKFSRGNYEEAIIVKKYQKAIFVRKFSCGDSGKETFMKLLWGNFHKAIIVRKFKKAVIVKKLS